MAKLLLILLGVLCFIIIVFIPWLVGIGDLIDRYKKKDDWYLK